MEIYYHVVKKINVFGIDVQEEHKQYMWNGMM